MQLLGPFASSWSLFLFIACLFLLPMAALTASSFASRSSNVNCGVASSGSDSKLSFGTNKEKKIQWKAFRPHCLWQWYGLSICGDRGRPVEQNRWNWRCSRQPSTSYGCKDFEINLLSHNFIKIVQKLGAFDIL